MHHDMPLISTIVMGLVLAFFFGAIANRFKMPPLVGYLVAGILVGPYTPGYVADQNLVPELAEIGVILLMFGVGLHFSLKDLLSVRGIAVPGAVVQIGFATFLGWGLGMAMGWSHGGSLVFGLALSVASTVVLLKALQERRLVETERGRIAVGWLIVEDLAMVLALVLIPAAASLASGGTENVDPMVATVSRLFDLELGYTVIIGVTILKVAAFVGLMLVFGRRVIPWILHRIAHTGSRELFRLGVLAIALGVAFGAAKLFGVSLALGAFFAGMILSESELSHRAAQESLPLRDAFAVLFFVSVGMLFDPMSLVENPLPILATIFIIVIGKSIAAFLIVLLFKKPTGTALTISASLAQIGEFSFILAELGVGLNLLPEEGRDLILAGAIISIILNPLMFLVCDRIKPALEARILRATGRMPAVVAPAVEVSESAVVTSEAAETVAAAGMNAEGLVRDVQAGACAPAEAEAPAAVAGEEEEDFNKPTSQSGHIILVGCGRVGNLVREHLTETQSPFLVIDDTDKRLGEMRQQGIEVIFGNAASPEVLRLANVPGARNLVVAIPNAFEAGQVVHQARTANPQIRIIARAHSDAEVDHLVQLGANSVIMSKREIARGMVDHLRDAEYETAEEAQEDQAPLQAAAVEEETRPKAEIA